MIWAAKGSGFTIPTDDEMIKTFVPSEGLDEKNQNDEVFKHKYEIHVTKLKVLRDCVAWDKVK